MRLTWLGHSTVAIAAGGTQLITDPLLRPRVAHLRRHARAVAAPERVDAVLLSHLHHDHLDVPSLRTLGARVVGPPGTHRALRKLGLAVDEVEPGDEMQFGGATVKAVPAVHDGRRWPFGARSDADAIGFTVHDGARHVFFAGDTELFDGMSELGPFDVALVPIWGWGPRAGAGHMDPEDAARSLTLLRPAVAIPIHWGTFLPIGRLRGLGHLLHAPPDAFREHARKLAPDVRVEILEPGGTHHCP